MNSPEIKLNTILKEIRTYESGPSVDGMKRLGLNYHKNFGVSLINLKKIAGKYYPNHELAKLLRTKNFRETKILSLMIDDYNLLDENRIKDIMHIIDTQELTEQFILNILEKDEKFYPLALKFINSEKEFKITAGFVLYARIATINSDLNDDFFEHFFNRGIELSDNDNLNIRKSIARAFRQTALRNSDLKKKVLLKMIEIKNRKSKLADLIYEEVVPLIDY
ncbi:MAG: DNA alkylation repair protein [Bacteroidales bacterium]|nr:DNA alkylation repair protein [Bacteroidales bacterium]